LRQQALGVVDVLDRFEADGEIEHPGLERERKDRVAEHHPVGAIGALGQLHRLARSVQAHHAGTSHVGHHAAAV